MLDQHLIAKTRPVANEESVVFWKNYRVTVLADRLFRLERSEKQAFRDAATLSVFYRDAAPVAFSVSKTEKECLISTGACALLLKEKREECRVLLGGKRVRIENTGNLMGTYRTLDGYDGDTHVGLTNDRKKDKTEADRIPLGTGVCSLTGVAVFDDADTLTLGEDGEVKPVRGDGSDEYIFAYGDDYRAAVKALYRITGSPPLIPRFALGNWWSRYYVYTDKEYLRLLTSFEEDKVPLTVATIDMDWHYSTAMEEDLHITEQGRNTPFYGGNSGWTGYTWNKRLFPDYKAFLKKIKEKNLKITLNLHPADGFRWFEDCYEEMAKALGRDPKTGEWIKFDIASTDFINAYFSVVHKPYERDGVAFWWIDWQQGAKSGLEGLDPLWALNHYHTLDNGKESTTPLILSRYSGIGSHRYPLGFSGDTIITWETLDYLPRFTATASNVGYTWWSHDIGGHMFGEKGNELYLRHMQYGVLSPINRLHCCNAESCTKEPWAYGNGAGEIVKSWLRFRHRLIPYLYTASYNTHKNGVPLVEPLYYEWKEPSAYRYENEYLFGGQLLVAPVTGKAQRDGFARVKAFLPEGEWTDIFTGVKYVAGKGGKRVTFLREMESVPVLIREGGVLPLSADRGNSVENPHKLEICSYEGNGAYTLYEDGRTEGKAGELFTHFKNEYTEENGVARQTLCITFEGDGTVVPTDRVLALRFKSVRDASVSLFADGARIEANEVLTDCVGVDLAPDTAKEYRVVLTYPAKTEMDRLHAAARRVLLCAEGETVKKESLLKLLMATESREAYEKAVDETNLVSRTVKACLKEFF